MAQQDGIDKYNGIMRFVRGKNAEWIIRLDRQSNSPNIVQYCEPADFDGVIIDAGMMDHLLVKPLSLTSPLVIIDCGQPEMTAHRRRCVRVDADNAKIGRMAADIMLKTGAFAAFAFMPAPVKTSWSAERGKAFHATLKRKGMNAITLDPNEPLAHQLRSISKPAAIFAANDILADMVLTECAHEDISVPEDLSVLGVDNEEITCYHATPPLASIKPDFEQAGYLSAKALDMMFNGKAPERHQIYAVKQLVPRQSLGPARSAGKLVQRTIELISDPRRHFKSIDEIARELGVSRRLLDLRFRQIKSKSIKQALLDQQFERVCNALKSTNLSIAEIAAQSGIGAATNPQRAFKRRLGMTMTAYRESIRKATANVAKQRPVQEGRGSGGSGTIEYVGLNMSSRRRNA